MELTKEHIEVIESALKRGNTIEIKKERENLVIVEISRKVKIKSTING